MKRTLFSRRAVILMLILAMAGCAAPQAPPPGAPGAPAVTPPGVPGAPAAVPAPPAPKSILGTWKGTSPDGQSVGMSFRADGTITVTTGSESNDGTFTVDFSMTPGRLDILGSWLGDKKIATLIEMVDKKHLRIQNNGPDEPRPSQFTSDATVFTKE